MKLKRKKNYRDKIGIFNKPEIQKYFTKELWVSNSCSYFQNFERGNTVDGRIARSLDQSNVLQVRINYNRRCRKKFLPIQESI